jgi:hypothetical protein
MGHHFFMTASFSVKSMRLSISNDGVHQRERRLAATTSKRSRRRFSPMKFVASDKPRRNPCFAQRKFYRP